MVPYWGYAHCKIIVEGVSMNFGPASEVITNMTYSLLYIIRVLAAFIGKRESYALPAPI